MHCPLVHGAKYLYLEDGREDNLNFYPNIKGEEVPLI